MLGAIIGDIIGSVYEAYMRSDRKIKPFESALPHRPMDFIIFLGRRMNGKPACTDDSILTLAIARAVKNCEEKGITDFETCKKEFHDQIITYYKRYQNKTRGWGSGFQKWVKSGAKEDNHSYANGSAMRVCAIGWSYETLEETLEMARCSSLPTHHNQDAIKGAKAIAAAIFLARKGISKEEIKRIFEATDSEQVEKYFSDKTKIELFEYKFPNPKEKYHTLNPVKLKDIKHITSKQFNYMIMNGNESAQIALRILFETDSYESAIRKAVSIGGDTDTHACLVGAMAEALYQGDEKRTIPKEWIKKAWKALDYLGDGVPEWQDDKKLIQWYERRKNDEI